MTILTIDNGTVFVNGKETTDPLLIGFAVKDIAEQRQDAEKRAITVA